MAFDAGTLNIKLFADGADLDGMLDMYNKPYIKGLTTNPTLMRKAGISDYKSFAQKVLVNIKDKPVSFEVFSDDFEEMERQGLEIASWGENVYVKIPITNTKGVSTFKVIERLVKNGCKINITAIMTVEQVEEIAKALNPSIPSYVSIFAGRIADTGRDPEETIRISLEKIKHLTESELIWASPRELLNIFQAEALGCHIITATNDLLNKLSLVGKDLLDYSLDTVKMFSNDAIKSGFTL
jgi:transaldolase